MAMIGKHNIAKMTSATTGTGTLTLGTALSGFNTFALAGVVDGERVTYTIRDGSSSEVGRGTYTASGTTLSRDTVLSSTNGGSKISCSGRETVSISFAAEDITPFANFYTAGSDTITDATNNNVLTLDTVFANPTSIASLSGNVVTIAKKGCYLIWFNVLYASNGGNFNGYITAKLYSESTLTHAYASAMAISQNVFFVGPILRIVSSDAEALNSVKLDNHSGAELDVYITEFNILKVGDTL